VDIRKLAPELLDCEWLFCTWARLKNGHGLSVAFDAKTLASVPHAAQNVRKVAGKLSGRNSFHDFRIIRLSDDASVESIARRLE